MKIYFYILLLALFAGCENSGKTESIDSEQSKANPNSSVIVNIDSIESQLKKGGYQTFKYKAGDTTYLMQQYYVVFLKSGVTRSKDSTEAAELQKKHLEHLSWLYERGYTSLTGPMGDDGDLRGMVVFNTASQKEADSLANLDPMVKAGRLKVEVHPWWVAKGGNLK